MEMQVRVFTKVSTVEGSSDESDELKMSFVFDYIANEALRRRRIHTVQKQQLIKKATSWKIFISCFVHTRTEHGKNRNQKACKRKNSSHTRLFHLSSFVHSSIRCWINQVLDYKVRNFSLVQSIRNEYVLVSLAPFTDNASDKLTISRSCKP